MQLSGNYPVNGYIMFEVTADTQVLYAQCSVTGCNIIDII